MFLKQEPFEYNGSKVVLTELSALQRIEYLQYLHDLESSENNMNNAMNMVVRTSAFLVAMSLAHTREFKPGPHPTREQMLALAEETLRTWPLEAIGAADSVVKRLSGMLPPASADGDTESEPVTAEKP
ncbi:phage minor tail protein G [Salmonella enterica subsp. enterica serovar Choleraesuis]|nr:phage minor tail protein G [Salmonella enterica subsp. enterica serovar Choleraesuis]